ncbi:MAG: cytochrome P450 [Candidatus Heimdallarchaeota archaeon]|nr:cytochrome P450 [Candidatus Heimdallarchaeota archaeon]
MLRGHRIFGILSAFTKNPLKFITKINETGHPIIKFKIGLKTGFIINEPSLIEYILEKNCNNYPKTLSLASVVNGGRLFKEKKQKIRKNLHFSRPTVAGKIKNSYIPIIARVTKSKLEVWSQYAETNTPLNMFEEITDLMIKISGETFLGLNIDIYAKEIVENINILRHFLETRLLQIIPRPIIFPTENNIKFKQAKNRLNEILEEILADLEGTSKENFVVNNLKQAISKGDISLEEAKDHLFTMIIGGYETTAMATTCAIYLLASSKRVKEKLQTEVDEMFTDEIPTVQNLKDSLYLNMVFFEALRMYPPAWLMNRVALKDDVINHVLIPANSLIIVSQYAMHHNPLYWENHADFNPERFENYSKIKFGFKYFPFGGGMYSCVAEQFAKILVPEVIGLFVREFDFEMPDTFKFEITPSVALHPENGLQILLTKRNQR